MILQKMWNEVVVV